MTGAPLILLTTVGAGERPVVVAAAEQLSSAIATALGREWPIRLVLSAPDDLAAAGSIWIASLIEDVPRTEPIAATAARWQARIERFRARDAGARVLLSTLFRKASAGVPVERLRRLNLMAVQLSRTAGVEIVDIDRVFAWCGARTLGTDYRCLGADAAAVGGHAIAAAMLEGDLAADLPPEVQERATALHGGVRNVAALLQRRTSRP